MDNEHKPVETTVPHQNKSIDYFHKNDLKRVKEEPLECENPQDISQEGSLFFSNIETNALVTQLAHIKNEITDFVDRPFNFEKYENSILANLISSVRQTIAEEHIVEEVYTKDLKVTFTCNKCYFICCKKEEFIAHLNNQHDIQGFENNNVIIKAENALPDHVELHDNHEPFLRCVHCKYKTPTKSSLDRHMSVHTDCGILEVAKEKDFKRLENDQLESNSSIRLMLQKSNQCKYSTRTQNGLLNDSLAGYDPGKKMCTLCAKTFANKRSLNKHNLRFHTETRLMYCFMCKFSTKYKKSIEMHMESHTRQFSYGCTLCEFMTANKHYLNKHIKSHTQLKPHACEYCDFRTRSKTRLIEHIRRHTGEKPFCCYVCGKVFISSDKLKHHMQTHSTDKQYKCNDCNFETRNSSSLRNHKKLHSPELYSFACNECDYVSKTKRAVGIHLRKHSGEKPYACTMCPFTSFNPTSYYIHNKRLHSGGNMYNCSDCKYTTSHPSNFALHRKIHTGLGAMICFGCNYTTTHRCNFKHHVNKTCSVVKLKNRLKIQPA